MDEKNQLLTDATQRVFDTTPDTVYGILVGVLFILLLISMYMRQLSEKRMIEMNISNIDVLKDLNTSLLVLKEEGTQMSDRLMQQLEHNRLTIVEKINTLQHNRNEKT